jgi:hypothetical protein
VTKLHSYLNFAGNAQEAFDLYKSVFGGEFSSLVRFKDFPMEGVATSEDDEDKIMHIALPIGDDNVLMASDVLESLGQQLVQGNNGLRVGAPDQPRGGRQDLQRPVRRGRGRDAHRRPGVGGLLREPEGQVWRSVDGEPQPPAGGVSRATSWTARSISVQGGTSCTCSSRRSWWKAASNPFPETYACSSTCWTNTVSAMEWLPPLRTKT